MCHTIATRCSRLRAGRVSGLDLRACACTYDGSVLRRTRLFDCGEWTVTLLSRGWGLHIECRVCVCVHRARAASCDGLTDPHPCPHHWPISTACTLRGFAHPGTLEHLSEFGSSTLYMRWRGGPRNRKQKPDPHAPRAPLGGRLVCAVTRREMSTRGSQMAASPVCPWHSWPCLPRPWQQPLLPPLRSRPRRQPRLWPARRQRRPPSGKSCRWRP